MLGGAGHMFTKPVDFLITGEGGTTIEPEASVELAIKPLCKLFRPSRFTVESIKGGRMAEILVESIRIGNHECVVDAGLPLLELHRNSSIYMPTFQVPDQRATVRLKNHGLNPVTLVISIDGNGAYQR